MGGAREGKEGGALTHKFDIHKGGEGAAHPRKFMCMDSGGNQVAGDSMPQPAMATANGF